MIEIKDALCALLTADRDIVAIAGTVAAVSSAWPAANAKYADVPPDATNYAALGPTSEDAPRARIAIATIAPSENVEALIHDDDLQLSVFGRDERLVGALARRVRAVLNSAPLSLPQGIEFREISCRFGPDLYENDTRIFHQPMDVNIRWVG